MASVEVVNNAIKISSISSGIVLSNNGVLSGDNDLYNQVLTVAQSVASASQSLKSLDQISGLVVDSNTHGYKNFAKEWQELNSSAPNSTDIDCSGDGRVILTSVNGSGPMLSVDYGQTWTSLTINVVNACITIDGSYIYASDSGNLKVSVDNGKTFNYAGNSRPLQVQGIATSATGKYVVTACAQRQGISVSNDFGQTWTKKETTTWIWYGAACSLDGSVMYVASDVGVIKKSTDFGVTWTTVYTHPSSVAFSKIACSGDGKYVLAGFGTSVQILLSNDFGTTFTQTGPIDSVNKIAISSNGCYMVISSPYSNNMYYSTDFGVTWTVVSERLTDALGNNNNNRMGFVAMTLSADILYGVFPWSKVVKSNSNAYLMNTSKPLLPSSGLNVAGSQYIDIANNRLYIHNGTTWKYASLL